MSIIVIFATLAIAGIGFKSMLANFLSYRAWCGRLTAMTADGV